MQDVPDVALPAAVLRGALTLLAGLLGALLANGAVRQARTMALAVTPPHATRQYLTLGSFPVAAMRLATAAPVLGVLLWVRAPGCLSRNTFCYFPEHIDDTRVVNLAFCLLCLCFWCLAEFSSAPKILENGYRMHDAISRPQHSFFLSSRMHVGRILSWAVRYKAQWLLEFGTCDLISASRQKPRPSLSFPCR